MSEKYVSVPVCLGSMNPDPTQYKPNNASFRAPQGNEFVIELLVPASEVRIEKITPTDNAAYPVHERYYFSPNGLKIVISKLSAIMYDLGAENTGADAFGYDEDNDSFYSEVVK